MKKLLTIIFVLCTLTGFAQATGNSPYDPGAARKNLSNVDALQLKLGDGTAAAPAYTFSSDPDTGIYSAGASILGFSLASTMRAEFSVDNNFSFFADAVGGNPEVIKLKHPGNAATDRGPALSFYSPDNAGSSKLSAKIICGGDGATPVDNASLRFYTLNSNTLQESARISAGGNVLIATSTDDGANKLQVNGSMRLIGMAAPTPTEGGIYFNSTDKHLYVYNGTGWVQLDN